MDMGAVYSIIKRKNSKQNTNKGLQLELEVKTNHIYQLEKALHTLSKKNKTNEIKYLEDTTSYEIMLNTLQKSNYKLSIDLHKRELEIKKLNEYINKTAYRFRIPGFFN